MLDRYIYEDMNEVREVIEANHAVLPLLEGIQVFTRPDRIPVSRRRFLPLSRAISMLSPAELRDERGCWKQKGAGG